MRISQIFLIVQFTRHMVVVFQLNIFLQVTYVTASVYLFLVSSRIRETRNEKFIFREISRLVFSKISRCIKEVKLEKSSIFKQLSFFRGFGVTIFGVSQCKMFHIFFFENSFTFYIFMPKNVRFTWNFEKRDETRNRHEKREVQNCREPGKFSSRDETRDKH